MKHILLIISGGIAAYKSLELIRRLRQDHDIGVRCVLTQAGGHFVTPLSIASLSGEKVFSDLFSADEESQFGHIQLSRSADLIVVAPATADIMAKLACGLANDLASTLLLATDKPVLLAPSMNVKMWEHPATQDNMHRLKQRGVFFVAPGSGDLACGEIGIGRMAEPATIIAEILSLLSPAFSLKPLTGLKALVTSGPTIEAIDPVRYLSNYSSGKQGYAIALALANAGATVSVVSGPSHETLPPHIPVTLVQTAQEMLAACESYLPVDIMVAAAAVSDWRVAQPALQKIKKTSDQQNLHLELVRNPDILATIARLPKGQRPKLVIGFAAETENLVENAQSKRQKKQCDWILANPVDRDNQPFASLDNKITFVTGSSQEQWPKMTKQQIAIKLVEKIVAFFHSS
ncbi:MAG TPA: bifunctional phosphopantothenoylcysteine decarboxylase/phosphopantothenate--cysteine ligase CoaBC [Alphaproteobacteria bacterium]|nr:bifunctional phosphopantothenoylcysteine decarboxylase/phosphopantothenate--cysteine ligase CoaBC [Alphaproteobacteria bacterium]